MNEGTAKRIAQAWAFAAILLLPDYVDQTSTDARMNSPVPLTKIALAHLTDVVIVAILFALFIALLRRVRVWPSIRWVLMVLLPVLLLTRNLDLIPFQTPKAAVWGFSLLWIAGLTFLILRMPRLASQLSQLGSSVLTGFAIFAAVMSVQLVRTALWRPLPQAFSSSIPIAEASPHKPRLVWILFDELAYRPTFEARDASLQLPNFDRLRDQSTVYTDVTPVAYRTIKAVPSLLLGHPITEISYTTGNKYLVHAADNPHWEPLDTSASLFGMAAQHGLTTSIVGWYVAYCPIFAGVATECYWGNDDAQDRGPTAANASFAEDVWFPLRILFERTFMPARAWADVAAWNADAHIQSVKDIEGHALETIASSQADILYIHLPMPHPPAFWNRHTQSFARGGSYLDSLDYSDRLLGRMLDLLEAQPRWNATTLIVQGDHSWRTRMWRPLPGWSSEDERISSGGQWDPRPVLMIHAAGQHDSQVVTAPTSLLFVHDAVAAFIRPYLQTSP